MSPKSRISFILVAVVFAGAFCIAGIADVDAVEEGPTATTYEIQYEVEGATQSFTGTSQTVTLKSLSDLGLTAPEGKTFTGWQQYDTTITVAVGSVVTLTAGTPIKFVAQFATTQYTITFVDGYTLVTDDTFKTISQTKVDYDGSVVAPADPEREGYVFEGWDPEVVTSNVKADATYTAQWREIFDVTWIVDGTKISTGTTESILTMMIPSDPVKTAFEFTGWYDAEGTVFDEDYVFTADVVFTAAFRADTYTVTFVYGEGDAQTVYATSTVEHGAKVVAPMLPSGYTGWDFDFATPITGDLTIKAIPAEPAPGMSTGTQIVLYIVGVILVIGMLMAAWGLKTGKIKLKKGKA